jgi:hypothetical protein
VQFTGQEATALSFLQCYEPTGVFYDSVTGQIIPGGKITVSGLGQVQVYQDGSTGRYCFCASTEGDYTIIVTPPSGYAVDASREAQSVVWNASGSAATVSIGSREDSSNPGFLQNAAAAANPWYRVLHLKPGQSCPVGNNIPVTSTAADTFAQWQAAHPLDGSNATTDNPDDDAHDNLMEYALGLDPESGVQAAARFKLAANGVGKIDAVLVRPSRGHTDLIYRLEGCTDLKAEAWLTLPLAPSVQPNNDETDTVRYADVSEAALFAGVETGFVRLKVLLDADHDGRPEASSTSAPFAFSLRALAAVQGTFSMPLLRDAVFSGKVQSVGTSKLHIRGDVRPALSAGLSYYAEIISGPREGQRYEVHESACAQGFIATDVSTLPDDLAGARLVLRAHWSLADLFPAALFHAADSATTADRVMFFANGAYQVHWLATGPTGIHWTQEDDATLASTQDKIIAPGQGMIIHPRAALTLPVVGEVRTTQFALPLAPGAQLVGGGWPSAQSFESRGMTAATGFVAAATAATADRVRVFAGDATPGSSSYTNYFFSSDNAGAWLREGDATLTPQSQEPLFGPFRAAFIVTTSARPNWVMKL